MADTNYSPGTVVASTWLNDVNKHVYRGQDFAGITVVNVKDPTFGAVGNGVADDTVAVQNAVASLGTSPGTVFFPKGTYKLTDKISCYAGQNFVSEGAILNVANYNSVLFSYNEANTFDFTNYYPPTVIRGFKVLGKVSTVSPNVSFVLVKINRVPYVTIKDCTLYYAAAAWVLGESILCTFENVNCYNPVSTCFSFTLGSGGFGPNNCTLYNCEIEEQKYPCTGVEISSGNINLNDCYIESLATGIILSGGNVACVNTQFGIRTQTNATGIIVNSANSSVAVNGGSMTFGGGSGGIAQSGIVFNASTELIFTDVSVLGIDTALDSSILFSIRAPVAGVINNNKIHRLVAGSTTTIFNISNIAGADYSGTFNDNYVLADAGATITFSSGGGGVGTLTPHIVGNRFARVSGFNSLNAGHISGNQFIGNSSTISWAGLTAGVLGPGNTFSSSGWTITNASYISNDNPGLTTIPTIASAALIAPAAPVSYVSGAVAISTIVWNGRNTITLIPTGLWATNTAGNIALGTTAVINKALILNYDSATSKWYPSY